MKYGLLFSTGFASILTACASSPSIPYNYAGSQVNTSSPTIQEEATSFVGDTILSDRAFYEVEALYLTTPVGYGLYHFPSGYYSKIGSDVKSDFYSPLSMNETGSSISQEGNARKYVQAIAVNKTTQNQICPIHAVSGMNCLDANIKVEKVQSQDKDSFEQRLLYNGRVGDKVSIGYREFSNGLARAAFANNVEYDLSQSKEITYKGAVLEIISANNNKITYKVLNSFSN